MNALRIILLILITITGAKAARGEPSTATSGVQSISAIAFNIWGVPVASYDTWRYSAAMEEIAKISPDIVALEEVFTLKAQRAFNHADYPYVIQGPRFAPRLIGSGLRILSKHPIESKATLVYRSCEKDDCLSRKGAMLAVVTLPSGRKLNVVVTHLNARGEDDTRRDQIDQLQAFIEYYSEPGVPLLLIGDFNFNPTSPVYPYTLQNLQVKDTWTETHADKDPGYTSDCLNNTYAHDYSLKHNFPIVQERIDFILSRGMKTLSTQLIFNTGDLLSDHYGIHASLEVQ